MAICEECGRDFTPARTGRPRRYCGQTCRKRASRRSPIPSSMRSRRQWVTRRGKVPMRVGGTPASSTDPRTWTNFADVEKLPHGVMMGFGLACYDLDHVLIDDELIAEAREFISAITETVIYAERSISGDGLHIFVESHAARGYRRGFVEFYPRGRFIAVTGNTFPL